MRRLYTKQTISHKIALGILLAIFLLPILVGSGGGLAPAIWAALTNIKFKKA